MPPVRWKLSAVTIVCCLQAVLSAKSPFRQEEISVDGWKPIVGTRKPHFYSYNSSPSNDFFKYDVHSTPPPSFVSPTVTPGPSRKPHFRGSAKPHYVSGRKIPHQKHYHSDPFFALPTHANLGPHIPIGAVVHTRPGQIGHLKPHATTSKPFIPISTTSKRNVKPMRIQTSTSSYRDDIFTASATSGVYNHYKHSPSNIRTRETLDLGLPGTSNHYSINQPHAHIEFNRFSLTPTSESVFEQYNTPSVAPFIFGKHPQSNDVDFQIQSHNDFNRNVIPSAQIYKNKDYITRPNIQENVVLQVPPPIQYTQQKINEPVQVHVTKEKLQEFHNNIPPNYHGQYIEYDFSKVRKPVEAQAPQPVYEVTENQVWQETPPQRPVRTRKPAQPKRRPEINEEVPVFLPTPYKPEKQGPEPTSPTQSEVSTIYAKLSKLQREKQLTTPDPFSFSVKEVSTHYPVFGQPVFTEAQSSKEISNEITTQQEDLTTTTKEPQRIRPHRRRRPDRRTTTTTTTEQPQVVYGIQQVQENENSQSAETERPIRLRRPSRYRTTTPSSGEETVKSNRGRNRYRLRNSENLNYESAKVKQRPSRPETTTAIPDNHKSEEYHREASESSSLENDEAASEKSEEVEELPKPEHVEVELPGRHHFVKTEDTVHQETIKPFIILTTTEKVPTTNLVIPEQEPEEDVSTVPNIEDTTTTTTPATTSSHPHRIKARPIKFDNSNRPRFSVKDYKQKLSLYSSTSAPQVHRSTESSRIRLPGRLRRPSTTTAVSIDEENTEPVRTKFVPKGARHSSTTEATNIITEKNVKSVNTRLRPFGRYKSTTASTSTTTTTPRVSIKSNLFNRKRPPMLSLRNKIYNKHNRNSTETTTEKVTTTEENEVTDSTVEYDQDIEEDSTTESNWKFVRSTEDYEDVETTTVADLSKIDPYFYSQRVSDLTSSAKNDYNTPGLFKSVSPTSRRIPSYFTIATDDPILPLEAFFSNIKDKNRDKDP